jgi:hypothetical protein
LWTELTGGSDYKADTGDALYRRSLYTFWKRTSPPPMMTNFDASTREACVVRTARTNTPLHFLAVMSLVQTDLYEGHADAAAQRIAEGWNALKRSFNLRIAFIRIEAHFLRGRAKIAAAAKANGKERLRLCRVVESDVRTLRDERFPYASHYADCIEACIAAVRGDTMLATELLERAALGFTTLRMSMHAAVCRFQLAESLASEQHRSRANFWFDAHSVANPKKFSQVFVPLP